jgi:hypothetical protein
LKAELDLENQEIALLREEIRIEDARMTPYGAVGTHGSIVVVGRFILTLKQMLHQMPLIPLRRESFRCGLATRIALRQTVGAWPHPANRSNSIGHRGTVDWQARVCGWGTMPFGCGLPAVNCRE